MLVTPGSERVKVHFHVQGNLHKGATTCPGITSEKFYKIAKSVHMKRLQV